MSSFRWLFGHLSAPSRGLLTTAAGITLVVLLVYCRGNAQFQRASFPDQLDRYYLPPPDYLKLTSLGYREAAAHLVWVATIQHGTDRRVVEGRRFPWLEQYLDATLALNPYMLKVYLWADATLTYARGPMQNEAWLRAIHYLERGHRMFPNNWELLFKLACAHTEMKSDDEALLSRWRRTAADYLWKAHLVGGGPPWLGSLAAKYWSEEGRWMLAYRRALEEFKATEDSEVKRQMAERLADLLSRSSGGQVLVGQFGRLAMPALGNPGTAGLVLLGEILQEKQVFSQSDMQVRQMETEREAFDEEHRRCLPYGSSDLFVLLGSCPSPTAPFFAGSASSARHPPSGAPSPTEPAPQQDVQEDIPAKVP